MDGAPSGSRWQFGDVTLVPDERLLLRRGQPVPLTPKAFDLLVVLVSNSGRLLTKEQLMQAVWGDTAVEESNLSYHVFAIRKALGDTAENGHLIETVPKSGYRFTATVTRPNGGEGGSKALADDPDREPFRSGRTGDTDDPPVPGGVARSASGHRVGTRPGWWPAFWFAAGVLCAGGAALLMNDGWAASPPARSITEVRPGVQLSQASSFALSPDGKLLVYAGQGPDGVMRLWVRPVGEDMVRALPGTEMALGALTPPMFWSPDSQSIAFDAAGQLKRFDLGDGATRTVCSLPALAVGGSWNVDDVIVVGQPSGGLYRCSAVDGRASQLTRLDPGHGETAHVFPWFLPDGRHFLYVRVARQAPEGAGVYLASLDDRPDAHRPERLIATGFGAAYVRTNGLPAGHVVFVRVGETIRSARAEVHRAGGCTVGRARDLPCLDQRWHGAALA